MDKSEKSYVTLGTRHRMNKQNKKNTAQKTKNMSKTDPNIK